MIWIWDLCVNFILWRCTRAFAERKLLSCVCKWHQLHIQSTAPFLLSTIYNYPFFLVNNKHTKMCKSIFLFYMFFVLHGRLLMRNFPDGDRSTWHFLHNFCRGRGCFDENFTGSQFVPFLKRWTFTEKQNRCLLWSVFNKNDRRYALTKV